MYRRFLALLATAPTALFGNGIALASDCASFERTVAEARATRDLNGVSLAVGELNRSAECTARQKEIVKRIAALSFYDGAIAPTATDERRRVLLKQGLMIAKPWKMSATLADLEFSQRNFTSAAMLYQDALDDMRDELVNPTAPPATVIEAIVKKAEQAALLASEYVERVDHRSGLPRGLAEPATRGFVAKRTAVPIQFNYREAVFTEAGKKAAEDMRNYLSQQNSPAVRLIGHTDARGPDEFNKRLSVERAKAVASYLKAQGYKGKIITDGRGAGEPYAGDGSLALTEEEVHQQNRRVELERLSVGGKN